MSACEAHKQLMVIYNIDMWHVSTDHCSYSCKKPCSGKWTKMDTCALKQLDAGEEYVYAVNQTNHVLSRRATSVRHY